MRLLRDHPEMADALADADISKSQALAIAKWTKKLPAELRAETIRILVQAAQAGASLDDLRIIAASRSSGGALRGPTPMMTGSTTATCRSAPRSAARA